MNWAVFFSLVAVCVILFVVEHMRVPTTLELHFKGDIKRESRWFAQYGQSVCTPVAALLVWELDPRGGMRALAVLACVSAASLSCASLKRSLGRVRPGREN